MKPKILALAGSARKDSVNKKLIKIASRGVVEAGGELTLIDINDYIVPTYHGDLEDAEGLPEKAKKLKKLFIEHDAFLISSPEYNSSIPGTFKNLIDWVSRPEDSDPYYLVAYKGKVAGLMSASPSYLGGLRGLFHLRSVLQNIGTHVIPDMVTISNAYEAFEDNGELKDKKKAKHAIQIAKSLVDATAKLKF